MLPENIIEETNIVFEDKPPPAVNREPRTENQEPTSPDPHDLAWRSGDRFTWHGKKLAPFAIDREGDWRAHRAALGAPELVKVFGEAFLSDALRILFFCSHEPEQWLAAGDSIALEKRIRAWAAENIAAGEQSAATILAIEIFNSAYVNRAVPEEAGGDAGE